MQFHIIIPYRPLCQGGRHTPESKMHQRSDGYWMDDSGKVLGHDKDARHVSRLFLVLEALQRNSFFQHRIKVVIDYDVFPHENFLKEYKNIEILKSEYIPPEDLRETAGQRWVWRLSAAQKMANESVPDNEWLCHGYTDIVCCKNWDRLIVDAIEKFGECHVYVPMFVELKGGAGHPDIGEYGLLCAEATPNKIWREWREKISCHSLTFPDPGTGYILEKDFDRYIEIANQIHMQPVFEPCGARDYGYYSVMVMRAKYAKNIGIEVGHGYDIGFDNRLRDEIHMQKVAVTNSFVLHNHFCPFYWTEEEAKKAGIREIYSQPAIEAIERMKK